MGKYKRKFKDKKILLVIIQPRLEEPLSYAETDEQELDGFLEAFRHAFIEALHRDARRERGDHCRFATCKATCELWTGPVFDLALLDPVKAALKASVNPTDYGKFLSKALDLAAYAEDWAAEVRRQAHVYMTEGGAVPAYKLVPKRGTRQWLSSDEAEGTLGGIVPDDNAFAELFTMPELRSVAQVEKILKKHDVELPAELWHSVSTGTTIAPADDARPNASHDTVVGELQEALKKL
jgi:hypothetical protein